MLIAICAANASFAMVKLQHDDHVKGIRAENGLENPQELQQVRQGRPFVLKASWASRYSRSAVSSEAITGDVNDRMAKGRGVLALRALCVYCSAGVLP